MRKSLIIFFVLFLWVALAYAQTPLPYTAGSSGTLTTATAVKIPAAALTLRTSTGTAQAKAIFFTVETAAINFTFDGSTPTVTAGTNVGHQAAAGQWFFFDFPLSTTGIACINAVASSGALIKYTIFF